MEFCPHTINAHHTRMSHRMMENSIQTRSPFRSTIFQTCEYYTTKMPILIVYHCNNNAEKEDSITKYFLSFFHLLRNGTNKLYSVQINIRAHTHSRTPSPIQLANIPSSVGNLIPNGIHRKTNIILRVMFLEVFDCVRYTNTHGFHRDIQLYNCERDNVHYTVHSQQLSVGIQHLSIDAYKSLLKLGKICGIVDIIIIFLVQ